MVLSSWVRQVLLEVEMLFLVERRQRLGVSLRRQRELGVSTWSLEQLVRLVFGFEPVQLRLVFGFELQLVQLVEQ